MQSQIDLSGKNVLVTGGAQGIGASICHALGQCGANLMINDIQDLGRMSELAEVLSQKYGIKVVPFQADVANPEEVRSMFEAMDKSFDQIDVLVNNAGIGTIDHAVDLDLEDWDRVMNVNLRGAFVCAQEAGKRMIGCKSGTIINISSIHDRVPRKGLIHYCASKAALNMMAKCLALELAEHNIRVITVAPGAIETEINQEEINKLGRDKFNSWIPLGRVGSPDDIARTCAFLASDLASYLTATEIYIDGGYKENTIQYDPRPQKKN